MKIKCRNCGGEHWSYSCHLKGTGLVIEDKMLVQEKVPELDKNTNTNRYIYFNNHIKIHISKTHPDLYFLYSLHNIKNLFTTFIFQFHYIISICVYIYNFKGQQEIPRPMIEGTHAFTKTLPS